MCVTAAEGHFGKDLVQCAAAFFVNNRYKLDEQAKTKQTAWWHGKTKAFWLCGMAAWTSGLVSVCHVWTCVVGTWEAGFVNILGGRFWKKKMSSDKRRGSQAGILSHMLAWHLMTNLINMPGSLQLYENFFLFMAMALLRRRVQTMTNNITIIFFWRTNIPFRMAGIRLTGHASLSAWICVTVYA